MDFNEINTIEKTYQKLRSQGRNILKLYLGNANQAGIYFPSELLQKGYANSLSHLHYSPHPRGLLKAREALTDYYEKQNIYFSPDCFLITSGTSESFFYLFSLLAKPGDNFLIPQPTYPLFEHIAKLAHVHLIPYHLKPHDAWRVDWEDLQKKTNNQTRGIVLISPNNPTGSVIEPEELEKITFIANKKNIPLLCDEVFSEFYFGEGSIPKVMQYAQPKLCFLLNGISKMLALPSLKLGWIAVYGESLRVLPVMDHLETMADTFLTCHQPIQEALPFLLAESASFRASFYQQVFDHRNLARALLQKSPWIDLNSPQGGFYMTVRIKEPFSLSEEEFVVELMKQKNIFVHPGYFYDMDEGIYFVFSLMVKKEILTHALTEILSFIEKLQKL